MTRRKLIFFADHGDTISTGPVWTAYYFALVAHRAGLEAEVRLAADAIEIFKRGRTALSGDGDTLSTQMQEAAESGLLVSISDSSDSLTKHMQEAVESGLFISVCDSCDSSTKKPRLSDADLKRWGAVRRELSEILVEVAEGRSELIYLG